MIQFITHKNEHYNYTDGARMALEGGCRWIQLRMKEATHNEILNAALTIKQLCKEHGAKFIIDDHVDLAMDIQADGVHLGKNDMPVDEARHILGHKYIIGGTANTFDDIVRLANQGADYIGCGPFRFTNTKKNLSPILGLEGYSNIVSQMGKAGINLPIIAIGGILYTDLPDVMHTGVNGVAVSGAILNATNPVEEMKRFVEAVGQ